MSSSSNDPSSSSSPKGKGKARVSSVPELGDVLVHRAYSKAGEEVYRIVLDVATPSEDMLSLEPWKTVLTTPELRAEWDPSVEDAHLLEIFDHTTRICKTNFTLGWPAKYVFRFGRLWAVLLIFLFFFFCVQSERCSYNFAVVS